MLFDSFIVSNKRFKERFVKVIVRLEATTFFFDKASRSRFPLYWIAKPRDFKVWPRPMESDDEMEILSLFDALSRKLPCRRLIGAYVETAQWAAVRGMSFCILLCRSVFCSRLLTIVVFLFCSKYGSR